MVKTWSLQGSRLTWRHPGGDIYWVMPRGYELPSRSVLSLAEYLLLSPFGAAPQVRPRAAAAPGRTAVAFSGGVDSAAALRLVEDPVPIYTQVDNPGSLHKLENALLAVEEVGGLAIRSNQDQLPRYYDKARGFYGNAGFTTTSVLLAEHLGLETFADGNILEFVYLRTSHGHGTGYQRRDHGPTRAAFAALGLHYAMPCAGLTEVSTTRVAHGFRYAMGCMRGAQGQPCLSCLKCYRKLAVQGTPIPTNTQTEATLSREWVPVLATLLWARDHRGLRHPVLDGITKDYSFVDKWYPPSIELVPPRLRPHLLRTLDRYGIEPLTDDRSLRAWSSQVPAELRRTEPATQGR